jgi:hypothetical protein
VLYEATPSPPEGCFLLEDGKCHRLPEARGYVQIFGIDQDSHVVTVKHYSGDLSAPCEGGTIQTYIVLLSECVPSTEFYDDYNDTFISYVAVDDDYNGNNWVCAMIYTLHSS